MSRRYGWYWVKLDDEWFPAYYGAMAWTWAMMNEEGFGALKLYEDEDVPFREIGPRIPSPDEPWQTVPTSWAKYDPTLLLGYLREETAFDAALIGEMLAFAQRSAAPSPDQGERDG